MGYGNGNAGGGLAGHSDLGMVAGQAPPTRALIPTQLSGLEQRLDELHEAIALLNDRLSVVSRSEPPATPATPETVTGHGFAMANVLQRIVDRVDGAAARVHGMLGRLEI